MLGALEGWAEEALELPILMPVGSVSVRSGPLDTEREEDGAGVEVETTLVDGWPVILLLERTGARGGEG